MLFPTVTFALFFVIVLPVSWLLAPKRQRWELFMLAASYVFYGWWNWRFVALIILSTLWNEVFGNAIFRSRSERGRRALLGVAVAGNLGVLGLFKYYDFFLESFQDMLGAIGIEVSPNFLSLTLPVGISFFTFQALSYIIDIYRKQVRPVGLLSFAVYLAFFPQLVAGPIVRAVEFLPQLFSRRDPRNVDAAAAFFLIVVGLFKKVVLANFLATEIVDPVFGNPEVRGSIEILIGVYAYAVQIYADFSGYTDIAIGIALLLGFRFPQNFNAPYTAVSIQDFWRRWHMTLSRWLRDYLYIPLGGNRGTAAQTYRNLFLTMLLGGLWHGAGATFVAWGALHGGYLVFEHWRSEQRAALELPEPADTMQRRATQRLVTFHLVCFGWIFFRAETFSSARVLITRLLTAWGDGSGLVKPSILVAVAIGIGMQYVPRNALDRIQVVMSRMSPVTLGLVLAGSLVMIDAMGPQGVAPFIYFQF